MSGGRLSAIARLRLRNGATETHTQQPETPSPPVLESVGVSKPQSIAHDRKSVKPSGKAKALRPAASETTSDSEDEDQNQFVALQSIQNAKSDSSREIEQTSETSVRIRLSRGQRCTLLGICALWIKVGSVSVYGAVLEAGEQVHNIYAPDSHALPQIEAIRGPAEIELNSIESGLTHLRDNESRNVWAPLHSDQAASFSILGHTFDYDNRSPGRYRLLDLEKWKPTITELSGAPRPAADGRYSFLPTGSSGRKSRRIVVCGRRSTGVSTFCKCLINSMLTERAASGELLHPQGVLFLDLDIKVPEYAPTATISLVHVRAPIFGPQSTHLVHPGTSPNAIIGMHFLGSVPAETSPEWMFELVNNLFDLEHAESARLGGCSLVMNTPAWVWNPESKPTEDFCTNMGMTDVVSLQPQTPSLGINLRQLLDVDNEDSNVYHIVSDVKERYSKEIEAHLQSYFHLSGLQAGRDSWDESPLTCNTLQEVSFPFRVGPGTVGAVEAVIVLGGELAVEDTCEALEGAMVALLTLDESIMGRDTVWTPEGFARLRNDIPPRGNSCIGLALITAVNIEEGTLTMTTPIDRGIMMESRICVALHRQLASYGGVVV